MNALDTNVLLRLLVDDVDEEEAARQRRLAARLVDRVDEAGDVLFVSDVVLCEVVWAMRTRYRVARAAIRAAVANVLGSKHLSFSDPEQLARALDAYAAGRGDFADYLIREHARAAGCEAVVTFDQALLREDGFRAP